MEEVEKKNWWTKLKRFYYECVRVFKVTRKPSKLEFRTIVKVSGVGMIIIGMLGFLIQMIKILIFSI
ncbi:protein translocase SEC61 complex subunit gamma [Nanoarchaeota archaeon]